MDEKLQARRENVLGKLLDLCVVHETTIIQQAELLEQARQVIIGQQVLIDQLRAALPSDGTEVPPARMH